MEIWYIIQIFATDTEIMNQAVIVPSNWVIPPKKASDRIKVKYMQFPFTAEDALLVDTLSQTRATAPESWPSFIFMVHAKARTWLEAENALAITMGGDSTIHNSSNNDKTDEVLNVSGM